MAKRRRTISALSAFTGCLEDVFFSLLSIRESFCREYTRIGDYPPVYTSSGPICYVGWAYLHILGCFFVLVRQAPMLTDIKNDVLNLLESEVLLHLCQHE